MSRTPASNLIAALAVALIHLVAIGMLNRVRLRDQSATDPFVSQLIFLAAPIAHELSRPPTAPMPVAEYLVQQELPYEMPTAITTTPLDWRAQSAQSAAVVVGDLDPAQGTRSLDTKPNIEKPALTQAPSTVFSRAFHHNGDSQFLGGGELITWIDALNGRCYVTNQRAAAPRLDDKAIVVVCKHRKEPVRDHLLDDLKPRYLNPAGAHSAKD